MIRIRSLSSFMLRLRIPRIEIRVSRRKRIRKAFVNASASFVRSITKEMNRRRTMSWYYYVSSSWRMQDCLLTVLQTKKAS
ncbi:hypothetical protein AT1G61562 [Arabidopsis thaliana]|uniref:Uncharacterized protein n=1 Tax=Arabidopsis thaliana TaxID=3702 RepID=A0A1P8AUK9_ARATH|nr:uncharacterized protein AT1G61562 [Arabidopsis thaliana]ANM60316.1 hypothetical protein AT1G61562 [Arabidopsis thaliana]|eukprot:NP_001322613.1 hypothetical protein AT1G61562 [Arabidopsis thaliana]